MKTLILVDFENEWIDSKSEYYVVDIKMVIDNTNRLIDWARKNSYQIIFTLHEEPGSTEAFAPNSKNTQLISTLKAASPDIIIKKNKISPFYQTDLERYLQGSEQLMVAGILTNLCVRSTIADAYDRDFSLTVVTDCCVALNDKIQTFTLADLKATRPEIKFMSLTEIIS